ncbi:hypothetical protein CCAX7_53530 [Capsulimonas corticalis]|uniref:Uncharacterized protein n=1 Tax=Capsulimonas corticalis TaxID=2219043 RepID=A0A402CNU7_9BACT|nr:hypothetical protein [Capsulimonas corticalis]BDI33302.1 hypothetical protein CCAX7_53530 [Capsulimonas corticalis]
MEDQYERFEDDYFELSGYLASFIDLQYEEKMSAGDINVAFAKATPLYISLVLQQGNDVLQWSPFPVGVIEHFTRKSFDSELKCREWLAKMLEELDRMSLSDSAAHPRLYVSLKELLRSGKFAGISPSTSIRLVMEILGEPDAVGGMSRKYRRPGVYLYGSVELNVSRTNPQIYIGAHWDVEGKGEFRFSTRLEVLDWDWKPGMMREQVEAWLIEHGLAFEYQYPDIAEQQWLRVESGVEVSFDEAGVLGSVHTSSR